MLFSTDDFVQIYSAYSEPHRKYHNFNHVMNMFEVAKKVNYKLLEPQEIAIFLHDVVYKIGEPNNEILSAEYAKNLLHPHSNYLSIDKALLCILSTQHHKPLCEMASIVVDLDLSCFCFDYETHKKNIYDEFIPIYGEEKFFEGRINFLQSMLARENIYCTEIFKNHEEDARENIKQELEDLSELKNESY